MIPGSFNFVHCKLSEEVDENDRHISCEIQTKFKKKPWDLRRDKTRKEQIFMQKLYVSSFSCASVCSDQCRQGIIR